MSRFHVVLILGLLRNHGNLSVSDNSSERLPVGCDVFIDKAVYVVKNVLCRQKRDG